MKNINTFTDFQKIKAVMFDFDGVFTENHVIIDESGSEYVKCSRYDGFGVHALVDLGLVVFVITTETKPLASQRCKKLNLQCFDSVSNKLDFAANILQQKNITLSQAAFFGNDINDLSLLEKVLMPVVTPDCHGSVRSSRFYTTSAKGGMGCVRELADCIHMHLNPVRSKHF